MPVLERPDWMEGEDERDVLSLDDADWLPASAPERSPNEAMAPPIDLSRLRPEPSNQPSMFSSGMGNLVPPPESPDWAITQAIALDPKGFVKAIPETVMTPFSVAGKMLGAAAADIGTSVSGHPEYGGNLSEFFNRTSPEESSRPTPQQETLSQVSKTNPVISTAAKVASGLVETAPLIFASVEGLVGKLIALGFSADMISKAPEIARGLGDELGKPAEQRDMDRLTTLVSDAIQTGVFAPLAGSHGLREVPGKFSSAFDTINRTLPRPPIERTANAETIRSEQPLQARQEPQATAAIVEPKQAGPPAVEVVEAAKEVTPEASGIIKKVSEGTGASNKDSLEVGLKLKSVADLDALKNAFEKMQTTKEGAADFKAKLDAEPDFNKKMQMMQSRAGKNPQYLREAIETATNSGAWEEGAGTFAKSYGERPLDWRKNPEVKAWLEKNGETIWRPDEVDGVPVGENPSLTDFKTKSTSELKSPSKPAAELKVEPPTIKSGKIDSKLIVDPAKTAADLGLKFGGETDIGNGQKIQHFDRLDGKGTFAVESTATPAEIAAKSAETAAKFEPATARPFFDRQSEAEGLGRPSTPPTVEDVRRQMASEKNQDRKNFKDVEDEDLVALYHRYRNDYSQKPTNALDKRIELIGDELAHRSGLPTGTKWGTRGESETADNLSTISTEALDPATGNPLSATDALVNKLETPSPAPSPRGLTGEAGEMIQREGDRVGERTAEPPAPPAGDLVTHDIGSGEPPSNPNVTAADFQPPKPLKTSNKNATVDAERKARGLPPMMETTRQSNQSTWDEAMRKVEENPLAQDELVNDLTANPRALNPVENAMLLHRRVELRNEYEKGLHRWKEAFEANDMVRAADESKRVKDWSSKLADLEDITKQTGAESGRSLQARKMMANEDYTLATMELSAMEAKGRNLTPQEHVDLIKAHEKIAGLENQIKEMEAGRETKEVSKATSENMKEVSKEAPSEARSKDFDIDREEKLADGIKAKMDNGQVSEITPLVQQLARVLWRRGVRGQEPMIDGLHEILKSIAPEFTRDQTQRAFSGYGDFTPLSKAAIDVGLRDLRGQTQQVLKLEALEARKPLEKTGQERRVPSDEERRLIKQVNELKRKYGVVVTDPATQLKSALQSRKTYYEHRISDLKHEIATRERIVKTKSPSPTDPELDALRAEHDRLKGEHDSIFPKREITDEQRLKLAIAAAERNQAHWETRLESAKKGNFDPGAPGRKITSPELEAIKARTEATKEHVQELKDLDVGLQESKQVKTLESSIAEFERRIKENDLAASKTNQISTQKTEALKAKRDALSKQLQQLRENSGMYDAGRIATAEKSVDAAIAESIRQINEGDLAARKGKTGPTTPEIEAKRAELADLQKIKQQLRNAAKPKKTADEIALQSLKTRMKSRTAELQERIARYDFTKRERKPVARDAEANRLQAELDTVKEEFNRKLEQDRWAKSSVFEKTKRKVADTYDAARALMTTGEFSFILRQGKVAALSHPIRTAKALPDMFRALLASEQKAHEIDLAVHNHPDATAARAAKLAMVEEGVSLHKQEEILMGRWVGKIPIAKNFNRAAQVFLNRVRFDMWQAMRKSMSKSGTPTLSEDRQLAMFVNEATGRGGLGKLEPAAVPLARVMFSPRFYASRLQLAAGHSLWGGTGRTRRIIATEYGRTLIGLGLYYTALHTLFSGGDDKEKGKIENDPRSTDFGKVRLGNTRLDPLAGLSQVVVMAARTASGEKKTSKGEILPIRGEKVKFGGDKWSDIMARHLRGKLHPVPAAVANLFDGTDLKGNPATVMNQAENAVSPMTYLDIYAALKEQDLPDGVALSLLAMLGEGLQTYQKRPAPADPRFPNGSK